MSQCKALQIVENGGKNMTYAYGSAQYHWKVSPREKWVLFDVKKDPGCKNDLSQKNPQLISQLARAHDQWWNTTYPEMIAKGGDLGTPKRNDSSKGKTSDRKP